MESYSSSSNSSENSDEESKTPPQRKPKFIHSWSSSCKDKKIRARPTGPVTNSFKNDGSFLEMFKKMQEQNSKSTSDIKNTTSTDEVQIPPSNSLTTGSNNSDDTSASSKTNRHVGKRRTARVLPTGLVKKQRKGEEQSEPLPEEEQKVERKNDPWSKYMDEVKKYKQQSCTDEESSRRPLVK